MQPAVIIGLDLAKNTFQLHGAAPDGAAVCRKKLSRGKVLPFLASQPAAMVAMEACASAHPYRPARTGRFRYADRICSAAADGAVRSLPSATRCDSSHRST